ncbi:hypothetical protein PROFUN_14304 [Planoprotostelium fungivorum]|uniref:Uncharacterized protein n=1 Tax=Planoprotostelium fungivorum TaxID=1890364 RepID=A0A2P6N0L8_9EUKA|nr:hypothetical protein PROFUN_14304 [Planoprotostelium fungivorum]
MTGGTTADYLNNLILGLSEEDICKAVTSSTVQTVESTGRNGSLSTSLARSYHAYTMARGWQSDAPSCLGKI